MYGLPKDQDFGFLVGAQLDQVAIGRHQVVLNFDRGISVSMQCSYGVLPSDGAAADLDGLLESHTPGHAASLLGLLGQTIVSAIVQDSDTLALAFNGGRRLAIRDDSEQYESFQIAAPEKLLIV
jgi:hypothetical protein